MHVEKYLKHRNEELRKFQNCHAGERVFLLGNGPSLAETDLNLLSGEISIAMNRISLIYPKYPRWRPTYYIFGSTNIRNRLWGKEWRKSVRRAVTDRKTTSFIAKEYRKDIGLIRFLSNIIWLNSITETKPSAEGEISDTCFSTNAAERLDKSGTSMNLALQLAYHMGFSEIIFVGVDLGWAKDLGTRNDPNHFALNYQANIANPRKANYQMRNVHSLALKYFSQRDPTTKIYNASLQTTLDVYPIIDFARFAQFDEIVIQNERLNVAKSMWDVAPQFEKS